MGQLVAWLCAVGVWWRIIESLQKQLSFPVVFFDPKKLLLVSRRGSQVPPSMETTHFYITSNSVKKKYPFLNC